METIKIMKSEEMHNLIEDNLATWKQFIGACVYQNKADEKVMIKLPCKLTLQSDVDVNAITFVKTGDTMHTIFANFEDGKVPSFCCSKNVEDLVISQCFKKE